MITNDYFENIDIGIVQTTLDYSLAWQSVSEKVQISKEQEEIAWYEICKAFRSFNDNEKKPDVVLFPELSIPRPRLHEFAQIVCNMNIIAIAGIDYYSDDLSKEVINEGLIIIPKNYSKSKASYSYSQFTFGKTFASPRENEKLKKNGWKFVGDENVYIFDCLGYGKIGISICYDFMDVERALMYRGRLQHLLVIAYNRDVSTFISLAESFSRIIFCNVVICNTGYYGGSVAVSPYNEEYRRTVFSTNGQKTFISQVISLPVKELVIAQKKEYEIIRNERGLFKDPPPGFLFSI